MSGMISAVRSNLSNSFLVWKKKVQGYNGIRTHDLRNIGGLYQQNYACSFEMLVAGQFWVLISRMWNAWRNEYMKDIYI